MDLKRGIDRVVETVVKEIEKRSKKVSTHDEIPSALCWWTAYAGGPHIRMTPRCRLRASVAI